MSEQAPSAKIEQQNRDARFAMWLSLIVGLLMLVSKVTAYLLTGSSAIFSDAAESVVLPSSFIASIPSLPSASDLAYVPRNAVAMLSRVLSPRFLLVVVAIYSPTTLEVSDLSIDWPIFRVVMIR